MLEKKYGTRSEVWNGIASQTRGGLKSADLALSKSGKLVSKRKQAMGKKLLEQYCKKNYASSPSPSSSFAVSSGSNQARRLNNTADSILKDLQNDLGEKFDENLLNLPSWDRKKKTTPPKKSKKPKKRIVPTLIQ